MFEMPGQEKFTVGIYLVLDVPAGTPSDAMKMAREYVSITPHLNRSEVFVANIQKESLLVQNRPFEKNTINVAINERKKDINARISFLEDELKRLRKERKKLESIGGIEC